MQNQIIKRDYLACLVENTDEAIDDLHKHHDAWEHHKSMMNLDHHSDISGMMSHHAHENGHHMDPHPEDMSHTHEMKSHMQDAMNSMHKAKREFHGSAMNYHKNKINDLRAEMIRR